MRDQLLSSTVKFTQLYTNNLKFAFIAPCRFCSTKSMNERTVEDPKNARIKLQNDLFNAERVRQEKNVGRIEKITVKYKGQPKDVDLVMNKYLSTPYHCAKHMYEMLVRRSALALINGETLWDMHRPLEENCELQLLHFQDENPSPVNKAFWRTCSLMLGAVLTTAFKSKTEVILHSFPRPSVRSGSFVYDVEIPSLSNWTPNIHELRVLSAEMVKLSSKNSPLERLSVSEEMASKIFEHNKHKLDQIPAMIEQSSDKSVVLYRIGDHIDISRGPCVGNVSFLGKCTITSAHKLENDTGNFYRFQGVSLPRGILLNHFAYSVLEKRAQKLNKGLLPWQYEDVFQPELQSAEVSA